MSRALPRPPTERTVGKQHRNIPLHEQLPDDSRYSRRAPYAFRVRGGRETVVLAPVDEQEAPENTRPSLSDTVYKLGGRVLVVVSPGDGR